MFYRRKIILALLQAFEGNLPKISLQKLLFLFTKKQIKPDYEFVPYHYGCYSFSANADLTTMVKKGFLAETINGYEKVDKDNYINFLTEHDRKQLIEVKRLYGKLDSISLMKLTYTNYQYFAINSIKAKDILTNDEYIKVKSNKPLNSKTILYTIGYEGISLEEYLNRLIRNDVRLLIDVRKNALSMKYGFSKTQLKKFCSSLGIEYLHIPELGILSEQRRELKTQADYNKLFEEYKKLNLKKTLYTQKEVLSLLIENKRVALTCFEANICQCHRKHLSEAITKLPEWKYELKHI
jgi:uncharacterized protein (DUF488 family)